MLYHCLEHMWPFITECLEVGVMKLVSHTEAILSYTVVLGGLHVDISILDTRSIAETLVHPISVHTHAGIRAPTPCRNVQG